MLALRESSPDLLQNMAFCSQSRTRGKRHRYDDNSQFGQLRAKSGQMILATGTAISFSQNF